LLRQTFNIFLLSVWMFFYTNTFALSFANPQDVFTPPTDESCTPQGVSPQKLTLSYSQSLEEKGLFTVGWNLYSPVLLNNHEKPALGSEIQIARCLPNGRLFIVGQGTVEYINGTMVHAKVKGFENSMYSYGIPPESFVSSGNLFWRPMVGDMILYRTTVITKAPRISPKYELWVEELFMKSSDGSYSFDLSEQGREILYKKFGTLRPTSQKFLIEGFSLKYGDRGLVRTETLMRAQTVASYLAAAFNLNPNAIVSIGYGSDWFKTGMQPTSSHNPDMVSDGIILRVFPQ
jgi:hypothetical protein